MVPASKCRADRGETPQMGNEIPEDERNRTEHEACLDQVGPDHRLDPADDRVGRGDQGHQQDPPEIGGKRHGFSREEMLPDHHENHPAEIEADADAENPGEEEDGAGHVLGPRAEAHGQELIDALDAVLVVGADEGEGDHHAGDHRADGELSVEKGPRLVALSRRPKEGGSAGLGSHDRGKDRPPRDGAPSEREFFQRGVAATCTQAHPDNQGEIGKDDRRIDPESRVGEGRHGGWIGQVVLGRFRPEFLHEDLGIPAASLVPGTPLLGEE